MQVTKTVEETRKQIKQWKKEGKTIGPGADYGISS